MMQAPSLAHSLRDVDREAVELIEKELNRDASSLNLASAESYPTLAVREACAAPILGLEGYPGKRYHSGSFVIDEIELLCQKRALEAFHVDPNEWKVNVQPLSGSLANLYTYVGLLSPGDVILRMDLAHGGHISHGHQSTQKKISEVSHRFTSIAYHTVNETGIIDYDEIEELAMKHRPRLITTGYSAYCRLIDFARLRCIAKRFDAFLHCDMAHICGFIASELIPSPFVFCDAVTTTTYKTIRGPPGAMIFTKHHLTAKVDHTLFPRFQAGVSFANILAIAVALKQLRSPEMKEQHQAFLDAAQILASSLQERGYRLVSDGTDLHMMLIDLRNKKIAGHKVEKVLEMANIICNRNSIPGDTNGTCSGIRISTSQMVIRGMQPIHAHRAADFIDQGIQLAQKIDQVIAAKRASNGVQTHNSTYLEYFTKNIKQMQEYQEIIALGTAIAAWVKQYPPPALI